MELLTDNTTLLLSLLGAAIALTASLTSTVLKKPPVRVMAMLAVLGFLVVAAQQLISAALDAQSAADQKVADAARAEIIEAIKGTVDRTEDVVTSINTRLLGVGLESLGDPLISVDFSEDGGQAVRSRSKESASAWAPFAAWVADNRLGGEARLCMNLELDAGRTYRIDMILGYLLTGPDTAGRIEGYVLDGNWAGIADADFVDAALLDWPGVDCVLIYEGRTDDGRLVAYASARDFALELLLQRRLGRGDEIEGLLNRRGPAVGNLLAEAFSSLHLSVLETDDIEQLVSTMIEEKWSECVAVGSAGRFLVPLERVIRKAQRS